MAKKKSPRKRPAVSATASKALSQLTVAEKRGERRNEKTSDLESGARMTAPSPSRSGGVFEELYAGELRRRAEELSANVAAASAESGPTLTAKGELEVAKDFAQDEDDTSIPPVDVEAEQFFADGDSRASMPHLWGADAGHEDLDEHEPNAEHVRRASPEVLARRARLRKVTQRVVAAFAVIALVGLGKAALTRAPSADLPLSSVAHAAAALPAQEQKAAAAAPQPQEAPQAPVVAAVPPPAPVADTTPAPQPTKAEEPAAAAAPANAEAAKPAADPAPVAAAADPAAPAPSTDPKADKRAAQKAIDRGDNKGAIEAGERAIAADPDAETYLIVGAAYQQIGQNGKAHKVFSECVSKATHGPRGECAALR